jgi:D-arabinose 1-dehydrogenase-like Zn-dependent alcohol dehydrogenase
MFTHNRCSCVTGKTQMQGFGRDGYFQEYVVVDARNTMKIPSGLDVAAAAPLFCAGVTSFHAVEDCGLKPGQWIGIIGCGGLGHLGVGYAKAMGLRVIGIDIIDAQLEEAKKQGADHVFNSMTDKVRTGCCLDIGVNTERSVRTMSRRS